ncbi:unnamed protein product [Diamesa hyperborea]
MPNEQDKNVNQTNKPQQTQFPIDLANKVIVKATDPKSGAQTHQTFRTITQQPQMRVVTMPATGAQIIQTHMIPQTVLKPQIPGRSTITVSKSPATYQLPRGTATLTSIQGKNTISCPIRTPTPPSSGNITAISPAFVRTSLTPRTSSPTATVIHPGHATTWVSGTGAVQVQLPTQMIRSQLTHNRARILQNTSNPNNPTITANLFGQQGSHQNLTGNSTISVSTGATGVTGQPTFVATVLQPRPQATLVYTSQQQPFMGQMQRMSVSTTNQRQVRPMQRLPTTGIRVSTSGISIRQNVPGLTPTNVTQTVQARHITGSISSTSISNTIPARIIQVQSNQQSGVGTQVLGQSNQKILSANLMTLPIIVNNNRLTHSVKNQLQAIAHQQSNIQQSHVQVSQQNTQQGNVATVFSTSGQQLSQGNIGNQIITVSQQQIINAPGLQQGTLQHHQQQGVTTVVPLTISSRNQNIPIKTTLDQRNINNSGNMQTTTILPITKIVSQQQVVQQQQQQINLVSASGHHQSTPVYIHTRLPAPSTMTSTSTAQVITGTSGSTVAPTMYSSSGTVFYEHVPTTSASVSVVTSSINNDNNKITTINQSTVRQVSHIHGIISNNSGTNIQGTHVQTSNQSSVPVRFSPMVVDVQSQSQQQTHQIITMAQPQSQHINEQTQQQTTHMIIPVSSHVPTSPRSSILRKREMDPIPVKMQKKVPKIKSFLQQQQQLQQANVTAKQLFPDARSHSPTQVDDWSSDGSTTVSIPNSPSQEEDDLDAMIMSNRFKKATDDVDGPFSKFSHVKNLNKPGPGGFKREAPDATSPRKKIRRAHDGIMEDIVPTVSEMNNENHNDNANKKKTELTLKKPKMPSLMQTYKQTWKSNHAHFNRYSEVRPRDERRPTVMDLANQPNVSQRIQGWKVHHFSGQIDDMVEMETQSLDKLGGILKSLEMQDSNPELEKINDLIKGNMQRNRIIIDGINDAKTQLLKIFDHKSHALDIIQRCASKRNFKKR